MKSCFLLLCLCLGCNVIWSQVSQPLVIGEQHIIHSAALNEDRLLNIYLPADYHPDSLYPVLYVLDGGLDEDFIHITGLVQFFNLMYDMHPCIVVGIVNVDRKRDFTFWPQDSTYTKEFPSTGFSNHFMQFVGTELQPYIESQYHSNGTRMLIGQSLGGLMATEMLLKQPQLFTHYFIVSPSLWWDNERLLEEADSLLLNQTTNLYPPFVYIAVGKQEPRIMRKDARKLFAICKKSFGVQGDIQAHFRLMRHEDHATILHNAIYAGFLELVEEDALP